MPGTQAPALPQSFPCWVKAVYSWGGETKRDLGFVEGDLIECLNAGDGAWWMGRLKRDRRQVGLFPSNFVEVLQDQRSVSPMPISRAASPAPPSEHMYGNNTYVPRTPSPQHQPANRYARAASPTPARARGVSPSHYQQQTRGVSPNPYQQSRDVAANTYQQTRGVSPNPYSQNRGVSPNPYQQERGVSPNPYQPYQPPNTHNQFRATTPQPGHVRRPSATPVQDPYHTSMRAVSPYGAVSPRPYTPRTYQDATSPPAPPTHSDSYYQNGGHSRGPSPGRSPMINASTPSPLRSAMADIMTSLEGMSVQGSVYEDEDARTPNQVPFSPDDYSQSTPTRRPLSSVGSNQHGYNHQSHTQTIPQAIEARPVGLSSYVERMEDRLRNFQDTHLSQTSWDDDRETGSSGYENTRPRSSMMTPRAGNGGASWDYRNDASPRPGLSRNGTNRSNQSEVSAVFSATSNSSTSTTATSVSLMSGMSAGGFSATSAGSLARRKYKAMSMVQERPPLSTIPGSFGSIGLNETQSDGRGYSFHSGNSSNSVNYIQKHTKTKTWDGSESSGSGPSLLGGHSTPASPMKKKSGFFKKIIESAKASTATARSSVVSPNHELAMGADTRYIGIAGGRSPSPEKAQDWVQVRRDVVRSNTLSRNERAERQEKQEMMDFMVLRPIDSLQDEVDGDESADGSIVEQPVDVSNVNMTQVDKAARFVSNLPSGTTPTILANSHLCRPHRSDIQRLRAVFVWVAEKIGYEHPTGPFEGSMSTYSNADCRSIIRTQRGTSEEVAVLVMQMCHSIGIGAEVVRGYLKTPGEAIDPDSKPQPNHYWNTVIIDGEWRILDASLASPTHPKRSLYSAAPNNCAEFFYFLTRPSHACYTHIPLSPQQQHLVPSINHSILLALPCANPTYFTKNIELVNFDSSLLRIEGLEIVQVDFTVPIDIECVAEVEAKGFALDSDGDPYESGEVVKKGALAQVTWEGNHGKTYRVKAVLPGDEGQGILKIYAGPRGLMHSVRDNPHPLAFTLPISHTGTNPSYDFVLRHPTPHAQRNDLYVIQPQNLRLAFDNNYVFAVRQHASTMYVTPSCPQDFAKEKPAKMAIQTPSGKILRLGKKSDTMGNEAGVIFEAVLKTTEKGAWRALVLADRSARWCVFAEWICV